MANKKTPAKKSGKKGGRPGFSIDTTGENGRADHFPIAAIGTSAGGLEALRGLLGALPADVEMAIVIIQHLSPNHGSMLPDILSKATPRPVKEIRNGARLAHGEIYVMPPNCNVTLDRERFRLTPRIGPGRHMPVDTFFRSLAQEQPHRAIAIILSGAGSDGALGIQEIKGAGGITFAQDDRSARFDGMPRNAVATGAVDYILPPEKIAAELRRICKDHGSQFLPEDKERPNLEESRLADIFSLLRRNTGVDFSRYKQSTVRRRILRRMLLLKMTVLPEYIEYLRGHPAEVNALYQDILINVTGFFRDPEAFETLKREIAPKILRERGNDAAVRIWVPGCSTGEEAYSLAIILLESLGDMATNVPVQIFATDLSEAALAKARTGIYMENISLDVSPERLRRFFVRMDAHFQISKHIRDMCVFARQDIAQDHPFSRIDLVSCRNLLIYLDLQLQKKVFPVFHYALKPDGYLMLGTSETVGAFTDLFALVDKKNKIYQKKLAAMRISLPLSVSHLPLEPAEPAKRAAEKASSGMEVQKEADRLVLNAYSPPGVVVTGEMDIIQFRGQTGPYLEPSPGQASLNLMKMIRPPLLLIARRALDEAKKQGRPARSGWIPFELEGRARRVEVEAVPLPSSSSGRESFFMVIFREHQEPEASRTLGQGRDRPEDEGQMKILRKELESAKEYLQSIIEEHEATNEELKSANEEILSSNEELQSINEELETAREELQSTNEELTTLNEELQNRNTELNQVNNDIGNLLSSVNVPIVMLGNDLRIRRYTPMAEKILKLRPADLGRAFPEVKSFASLASVDQLILEVIDSMSVRELEVRDDQGHWYSLRIRPYRTTENRIDGAVLVFIDIDALKSSLGQLQEANAYAESVLEAVRIPMVVLEREGRIRTANQAYLDTFGEGRDGIAGQSILDLGYGRRPIPGLREMLARNGVWGESVRDREVEIADGGEHKVLRLNSGLLRPAGEKRRFLLLTMDDITAWRRAEREVPRLNVELETHIRELTAANNRLESEAAERIRAEESLRGSVADLETFSYSVSHDLRAPLRAMQGMAEALREDYHDMLDETGRDYARRIAAAAHRMDTLIQDLLNYNRLGSSKREFRTCPLDQAVSAALTELDGVIRERGAQVVIESPLGSVRANRALVAIAIVNLLSNAVKFTAAGVAPRVSIRSEQRGPRLRLWVEDNGIGIDQEHYARVFRPFERLNGEDRYPGTGIGLAMVRKSVESLGGEVGLDSKPGEGSRFWMELSMAEES